MEYFLSIPCFFSSTLIKLKKFPTKSGHYFGVC